MSRLKKNIFYNILYQILLFIIPLITAPYISRVIGAEGVGIYSYTHSVAYYFVLIIMLGVNNYGNRSIAQVKDDKVKRSEVFWSIYYFQFFMLFISIIVYLFYLQTFSRQVKTAAIIQLLYVLSAGMDINWFFFGMEEFKITVTRNMIIKLLNVAALFMFVRHASDVLIYVFIMAFGMFLSQLVVWPFLKKRIRFMKPDLQAIRGRIKPNIILFVPVVAVSLYKTMDKIFLGYMSSINAVGYYESAEKVINIPLGIITAFGTVMLPRISNLVATNRQKESQELTRRSMIVVAVLASAMTFGLIGVSENFVPIFFGDGYLPCIDIMNGLAVTILFISCANVIRTQYLIPYGEDKTYLISVTAGALVNCIINLLTIPVFGAMGAVWGTIIAEATVCFIQIFMVHRGLPTFKYMLYFVPCIICGAIMCLIVRYIGTWNMNVIIKLCLQMMVGMVIYLLPIILYAGHNEKLKSDILHSMKDIIKRR